VCWEFFAGQSGCVAKKSSPVLVLEFAQKVSCQPFTQIAGPDQGGNFSPKQANSWDRGEKFGKFRRKLLSRKE
jgi:hypothetical protein